MSDLLTGQTSELGDEGMASQLVAKLVDSLQTPYHGSSFMSKCVYDTAWVAMVSKPGSPSEDGSSTRDWLFPECFEALLQSQHDDGGFGESRSDVDGILNTMSAILALCKLRSSASATESRLQNGNHDLDLRISRGKQFLDQALRHWNVDSAVHVGFEILTPKLLDLLQGQGLEFQFPGRATLMALNRRKMDRIKPALFYAPAQTTALHSLEAFVGDIDMDKMRHHVRNGSMMASPSSTAAYLMGLNGWDDDAEAYLRFVVASGNGYVPSAFPAPIFETTWALTTLLQAGFTAEQLGEENLKTLGDFLDGELRTNGGVTGFARGVLADADDTAKAVLCLRLLGYDIAYSGMIKAFETETHFKTYDLESNESLSANCNVLIALLFSDDPRAYMPQITKALGFLSQKWRVGDRGDKWNLEPQYSMMLFAQGLRRTIELWDSGSILDDGVQPEFEATVREDIPLITLQMLIRTLSSQMDDGSWSNSAEVTAYALLTLRYLIDLPWCTLIGIDDHVRHSFDRGAEFLTREPPTPAFVWVEKVTYGTSLLAEAYCLAARNIHGKTSGSSAYSWGPKVRDMTSNIIAPKKLEGFAHFFGRLPLFSKEPLWRLRSSIVEGYMLLPKLRREVERSSIFPRAANEDGKSAKYLEYIPLTWTTSNNAADFGISTETICDMSVISVLNFQVDKYLEDATEDESTLSYGRDRFKALKCAIRNAVLREHNGLNGYEHNGLNGYAHNSNHSESQRRMEDAAETLAQFVKFVTGHPHISQSSAAARQRLEHQLLVFLEAHVTQGDHSDQLRQQKSDSAGDKVFPGVRGQGYYDWVRSTSADHTSCPYSFEFFTCLISKDPAIRIQGGNGQRGAQDCFSTCPEARYVASDVCRHLATLCRQYNDYGSSKRDHAEGNLNSLNFPEFHSGDVVLSEAEGKWLHNGAGDDVAPPGQADSEAQAERIAGRRADLMKIAGYERQCLEQAVVRLKDLVGEKTIKALQVFIDVTDLYGQIYVVRDINT